MLDWTDRHFRYFVRQITRRTLLYTEMVTTGALLHGDRARFLDFDPAEHPLALQLGGSEPAELAACCRLGEQWGYDEIDLNVGCPSDRVQSGRFGACLMLEPEVVADCIRAMRDATGLPVSVKHRTGVDHRDSYGALRDFVGTLAGAGCTIFIVHARKAWLQGLSPKENREVPPLQYQTVHRLKRDFPELEIVINGGITSLDQSLEQLQRVDGVMIGRQAYHQPWVLAQADRRIFGEPGTAPTRHQVIDRLLPYIDRERARGTPLQRITRHLLGLFHGCPNARAWRRLLSQEAHRRDAGSSLVARAAALVPESQ